MHTKKKYSHGAFPISASLDPFPPVRGLPTLYSTPSTLPGIIHLSSRFPGHNFCDLALQIFLQCTVLQYLLLNLQTMSLIENARRAWEYTSNPGAVTISGIQYDVSRAADGTIYCPAPTCPYHTKRRSTFKTHITPRRSLTIFMSLFPLSYRTFSSPDSDTVCPTPVPQSNISHPPSLLQPGMPPISHLSHPPHSPIPFLLQPMKCPIFLLIVQTVCCLSISITLLPNTYLSCHSSVPAFPAP